MGESIVDALTPVQHRVNHFLLVYYASMYACLSCADPGSRGTSNSCVQASFTVEDVQILAVLLCAYDNWCKCFMHEYAHKPEYTCELAHFIHYVSIL